MFTSAQRYDELCVTAKKYKYPCQWKISNTHRAQKPRVPSLFTEPLQKRLEEFEQNDTIEQVPANEAITWCSPSVVQPKPKNPKDIRASLDLRLVNKSMLRTRQVQAPITEDFIREFKDCKFISKSIRPRWRIKTDNDFLHPLGIL